MKTTVSNANGHGQNVHNFKLLVVFVRTMGANYNPPIESIKIEALEAKYTSADNSISAVEVARISSGATSSRINDLFASHDSIVTRSFNSFKVFNPQTGSLNQAHSLVRDMRGKAATDKLTEEEIAAEKEKGNIITQNTIHKSSVSRKIEFFSNWVMFLKAQRFYKPNEEEITVDALEQRLENYKSAENAHLEALALVKVARNNRTIECYDPATGMVATATTVKNYIKSACGANSAEYKYVSSIPFRHIEM